MRLTSRCFLIIAAIMALSWGSTQAANLPEPKVEYSADSITESGDISIRSRIFYTPGKQRMEQDAGGTQTIIINRMDKNMAWVLMPAQRSYLEMSSAEEKQKSNDIHECSVELRKMGQETINGQKTTKNQVSAKCPADSSYEGTLWITNDGIMMKMEALFTDQNNTQRQMKIEMKNVKIGRQDPKLFEIPSGYSKFGLGSMLDAFKNQPVEEAQPQQNAPGERNLQNKPRKSASEEDGRTTTAPGKSPEEDNVQQNVDKVKRWLGF
jgi:hypothetical protein